MYYTKQMIESLGYETIDDFVKDFIKKHKNCCITYMSNGVYATYDSDSDC